MKIDERFRTLHSTLTQVYKKFDIALNGSGTPDYIYSCQVDAFFSANYLHPDLASLCVSEIERIEKQIAEIKSAPQQTHTSTHEIGYRWPTSI